MTTVAWRGAAEPVPGSLMIESVRIENFRCFREIEARNLGRFNVIVGDNRSGKTSFLEALYLTCGNTPENHMKMRYWRGLTGQTFRLSGEAVASGSLWRDLFHEYAQDRVVRVRIQGKPNRSLTISYRERKSSIPLDDSIVTAPIVFEWADARGKKYSSIPRIIGKELEFPNTPPGIDAALIGSAVLAKDSADQFSELSARKLEGTVLKPMSDQFPEIEGLTVLSEESVGAMVYANIRGRSAKIPLPLVSAGINRWFNMIVTVASHAGGSVFIDEIDSGIYFRRLSAMWRSLNSFSKDSETQLFTSTHSREALAALLPVVEANTEDFRLVRLDREQDGTPRLRVFAGDKLRGALESDFELR